MSHVASRRNHAGTVFLAAKNLKTKIPRDDTVLQNGLNTKWFVYFGFDYATADTSELSVQRPVYERIPKTVAQRDPRDDEIYSRRHLCAYNQTF